MALVDPKLLIGEFNAEIEKRSLQLQLDHDVPRTNKLRGEIAGMRLAILLIQTYLEDE